MTFHGARTRRAALAQILGAGAMAMTAGAGHAASANRRLADRIGIQLFMLSDELQADLPGTLRRLAEIGYREVEGSPMPGQAPEVLRSALDRAGLVMPSLHLLLDASVPGLLYLSDMPAAIGAAKTLGAGRIVAPIFSITEMLARRPDLAAQLADPAKSGSVIRDLARAMTADDWLALARRLNTVGAGLAKAGIRLGYHTHNVDFAKLPNGDTVLDLLVANTEAKLVEFELDVGWAKAAGLDPAATLIRYADRVSQLHLKDLAATPPNNALDLNSAEFGAGVQDWPAIADAIRRSSVRHLYLEQEKPFRQSGLASAASGYAFVRPILARAGV